MSRFSKEAKALSKCSPTFCAMLVLLYLLVSLTNVTCESCLVTAFAGTFRGVLSQSRSVLTPNFPYCSFRGIRYAQPPKGVLRFARPVLAAPLRGNVYNATTDGNKCPQINLTTFAVEGDEDCLFVNVYTPQIRVQGPKSLLPVMVFIHGSGFVVGSSDSYFYGPDYLVPKNVVLVTFNYRLNVFGFLNLKTSQCSGNMGLADQILVCRWVQKNIQSFGGDPNRVTLFGQSAGGHSTYLLALSPQARGLFHRVIIQSTIFTTDSYLVRDASLVVNASVQLAQKVGYPGNGEDHEAVLRYLLNLPTNTLVIGYFTLLLLLLRNDVDAYYHTHGAPLFPCIDYYVKDGIIPTYLEELGRSVPPISVLIGFLDADASVFYAIEPDLASYTKSHLDAYLREANPILVKDKPTQDRVIEEVKARFYNPSNNDNEQNETITLLTFLFFYNLYTQISHLRASYLSGNVRIYEFRFVSGLYHVIYENATLPAQYAGLIKGATHGEEILYLFYVSQLSTVTPNSGERKIINEMTTWWTNFAKTGNPNSRFDGIDVEWKPSTPTQNRYLDINNVTRLVNTKVNQEDYNFFARLERFARYYQGGGRTNAGPYPVNAFQNGDGHCQQIPSINYGQFIPAGGVSGIPNFETRWPYT